MVRLITHFARCPSSFTAVRIFIQLCIAISLFIYLINNGL
jgi:hypothetical protein